MRGFLISAAAAIALAFGVVACSTPVQTPLKTKPASALRIGTYNVHYIILSKETGSWSVGDWDCRKAPMDAAFKTLNVDTIGFQEMESFAGRAATDSNLTLSYLLERNPEFAAAAVGDPADFPSTQPILYRTDRLSLLDQSWFFFSDTPDVIYSRTFNGSFPAFASLAQFEDIASGESFHVVNVHFEYSSRSNRLKSAALVVDRIQPLLDAGEKVIVIGDLNARAGAQTQNILSDAGLGFLSVQGATYHFNRGANLFGAIDHIGLSEGVSAVGAPHVLREQFGGEWPSDHYPVVVDIVLN